MAEIDMLMLGDEIDIDFLLLVQLLLAVVVWVFGYVSGRRKRPLWSWVGFLVALLLAVAAGGGTFYNCSEAWDTTQGRLQGRIPGQHMPAERAQSHLDFVRTNAVAGGAILAATVVGGGLLHGLARRQSGRR